MTFTADDARFMHAALALAQRNLGLSAPNPSVGAVIVDPHANPARLLGRGVTAPGGRPHAEAQALAQAGAQARGATMYLTLEPCFARSVRHDGPSCSERILQAGLARVVIAATDPSPLAAGLGVERLRAAGIGVEIGLLAPKAEALIAGHALRMRQNRPFVQIKLAQTLDGFAARPDNTPLAITGEGARFYVHRLRAQANALITGIGTVLADDPLLDCRLPGMASCTPLRVVLDTHARLPITARLARDAARHAVLVATAHPENVPALAGLAPLAVPMHNGGQDGQGPATGLDLAALLALLSERGVQRVLVEAGPTLAEAFAQAGFCDELILLTGPGTAGTGRPALGPALHRYRQQAACIDAYPLGPDQLEICRI